MATEPGRPVSIDAEQDEWERADVQLPASSNGNVDQAARILNRLELNTTPMRPPPAQDGGFYDPESFHRGPASSSMDSVLLTSLENPRDRMTVLKFEDQIVRFIQNQSTMQLLFPPLSSYHRLLVHRLAERCHLDHHTADANPYASYDTTSRNVTLYRTPDTSIPSTLLIHLSTPSTPSSTPSSAPKIMMRKRPTGKQKKEKVNQKKDDSKTNRTIQDREKAYAEARARIFGDDVPDASKQAEGHSEEWKQSRALYRNREEEMNDPDFTRRDDLYRRQPMLPPQVQYPPRYPDSDTYATNAIPPPDWIHRDLTPQARSRMDDRERQTTSPNVGTYDDAFPPLGK